MFLNLAEDTINAEKLSNITKPSGVMVESVRLLVKNRSPEMPMELMLIGNVD